MTEQRSDLRRHTEWDDDFCCANRECQADPLPDSDFCGPCDELEEMRLSVELASTCRAESSYGLV